MQFRTEVVIPSSDFKLSHQNKIMMIGSCFVENISAKLQNAGFDININPFGIMYNPISVLITLNELLNKKRYFSKDLFLHQGLYHSFSHHSRFSGSNPEAVIENINNQIDQSSRFLFHADYLFITWGTANVYFRLSDKNPVANCHKLPAKEFIHKRLTSTEITTPWQIFLNQLKEINPKLKIIFTISPIRHWKDGATENQISKSVLFVALDTLIQANEDVYYFPSYEIIMDDLRDYRFYAEDMLHPNYQAIDYIWEKFGNTYFNDETKEIIAEWTSIQQALQHKPFNPLSDEYNNFLKKAKERERTFIEKHNRNKKTDL
ncbi:MAG: GSCFA domain-containing protein [Dysgonamonadaceae bacterium]|jgi:hypothetical protein|nr:GSCFA domain-containing protein [Dysgonamonadaceae bacterium]